MSYKFVTKNIFKKSKIQVSCAVWLFMKIHRWLIRAELQQSIIFYGTDISILLWWHSKNNYDTFIIPFECKSIFQIDASLSLSQKVDLISKSRYICKYFVLLIHPQSSGYFQ